MKDKTAKAAILISIIAIIIVFLSGCDDSDKPQLPDRLQIVSKKLNATSCSFYVIKDTQTNQEFLVSSGHGSAVQISK